MFLWKSFEKFASTTELHGFDQVLKYNRFWAAVWLCLTVAACGMCVNDVVNVVITYQSEPTIIDLVLQPNVDLDPPNPTLCMEIYVDFKSASSQINVTYPAANIESDMQVFLAATQNAENLDIPDYTQLHLTDNLQYFTYVMLSYIAEAELTYIGYNDSVLTSFVTSFSIAGYVNNGTVTNNPVRLSGIVGYLYQRYLSKNVSLANLKRLIGMSVCQQRTGVLTKQNSSYTKSSPICQPHMITHLSFSIVCSKLLENDEDKLANYDNLTLSGTKLSQVQGYTTNSLFASSTFLSSEVTFAWHLDFQGRPMLPLGTRQDVFSWDPTKCRAFSLTVAAEYQFYSTKRNPCQSVEWQYDCDINRRIKLMENKCGCRPSSFLFGNQKTLLHSCSENPLKPMWIPTVNPLDNFGTSNFTGICGNQMVDSVSDSSCVRDCQVFAFDIEYAQSSQVLIAGRAKQSLSTGQSVPLPTGSLEFTLNMGKSRQLVVESPAKSFSTFICDFGGSIGAWLGASLLAFVHAVIHIFQTFYDVGNQLKQLKKKK